MSSNVFIAGDWGTTRLRLFLCDDSSVLERRSGHGVRALTRTPAEEFTALTQDWVTRYRIEHAFLSGMVGSRNGWVEAAYVPCPAALEDLRTRLQRFTAAGVTVAIVPGVSCTSPLGAPDVMRGEETQLLGALKLQPKLASGKRILVLPGTHSKWVEIEDGRIVRFQTALTGELFALLKAHSTLLATGAEAAASLDEASFADAVTNVRTGSLLHALFQVRSRQLLESKSPAQAQAWLSGLLIGADVDGALAMLHPGEVTLIGEPMLVRRYVQALSARGVEAHPLDSDACVLAGLRAVTQ